MRFGLPDHRIIPKNQLLWINTSSFTCSKQLCVHSALGHSRLVLLPSSSLYDRYAHIHLKTLSNRLRRNKFASLSTETSLMRTNGQPSHSPLPSADCSPLHQQVPRPSYESPPCGNPSSPPSSKFHHISPSGLGLIWSFHCAFLSLAQSRSASQLRHILVCWTPASW